MFNIDRIFEKTDTESYLKATDELAGIAIKKDFIVQDVGISSRVLIHWVDMGIIDVPDRKRKYTYIFNLVELIWLKLVKRLREFGFPIEKIKTLKTYLLDQYDFGKIFRNMSEEEKETFIKRIDKAFLSSDSEKQKLKKIAKKDLDELEKNNTPELGNLLFLVITEFLLYRRDVRILIDVNAKCIIDTGDTEFCDIEDDMEKVGFESNAYINVSVRSLFYSLIITKRNIAFVKETRILNENEMYIVSLLRDGKAKSITIKFKNQKPNIIEVTQEKKIYAEARLSEVLLNKGYQDIIIKTENGNIAVTNITTKKKLK